MTSLSKNLFLTFLPFYPIWAWFLTLFSNKEPPVFFNLILIPIALYFIIFPRERLPKYLIFYILFTLFHILSIVLFDLIPIGSNWVYFFLTDTNILACAILVIIENTVFDADLIHKMNRALLIVLCVSLVVSLIQIQDPTFFFNTITLPEDFGMGYIGENRNFSIYSWIDYHSLALSFPILISISLAQFSRKTSIWFVVVIILCGCVVAFLSRYRVAMISTLFVFTQLLLNRKQTASKRFGLMLSSVVAIVLIGFVLEISGVSTDEIVENRILEQESEMASANARVSSFKIFLLKFPENPWFGVGPKTKADVIESLRGEAPIIHIGYLSYLYYYGVFGATLLFMALGYLLHDAWRIGQVKFWGSFYGLLSFCITNLVFVYFNLSEFGVVLALLYLRYYKTKLDYT